MKMEGVGDAILNGRTNETLKSSHPSPKEIGREFVRQYYTMLAEKPQDVFRFYSHESFFVHGAEPPVQGQQKIQKAIERLGFVDCKARIYIVSGTATVNNGLVIQVCGELAVGNNSARRFLQTFVLCPQTPKKYYVHNDVFQWLDHAFRDNVNHIEEELAESSPEENSMFSNGGIPMMNGHSKMPSESNDQTESSVDSSADESEKTTSQITLCVDDRNAAVIDKKLIADVAPVENLEQPIVPEINAAVTEENVLPVDNTPKTWAKLVGSNNTYAAPILQQLSHIQNTVPPAIRTAVPQNQASIIGTTQSGANNYSNHDNGCHLFVGGITRKLIPDSITTVEKEIKVEFEKFGPVVAVNVPRRALDVNDPQRTVYAFVVMKSSEGAQNAFNATRKDRALLLIHLKIDSLGFDGEACLSEQKGNQTGARLPFPHRGGPPMQGIARGGFAMRSGMLGAGRGATRGMHPRHFNGGNDFRHMSEHDRH